MPTPTMTVLMRYQPNAEATEEQKVASSALLAQMESDGKTSGTRFAVVTGYNPTDIVPNSLIIRPFATLADAQEFTTFQTSIGGTNITYFNIAT